KNRSLIKLTLFIPLLLFSMGCRNSDFLDIVPDRKLVIPSTLEDFQAILDNDQFINGGGLSVLGVMPSIGGIAAEEFKIPDDRYISLSDYLKQAYTWQTEMPTYEKDLNDWVYPYRAIYYANTVLEGLSDYVPQPAEAKEWKRLKGSALFIRAYMHFHLAEVFAKPYREATANTDWGLPLRLQADLNERITRATMRETYDFISQDLE